MLLGYWSTLYRCRTVTTRGHCESSGGCTLCGLRQGMVFGESIESIREWAKGNRINRKFLIGFKKRNIWFGYVWLIYRFWDSSSLANQQSARFLRCMVPYGAHCAMACSELLQQPRLAILGLSSNAWVSTRKSTSRWCPCWPCRHMSPLAQAVARLAYDSQFSVGKKWWELQREHWSSDLQRCYTDVKCQKPHVIIPYHLKTCLHSRWHANCNGNPKKESKTNGIESWISRIEAILKLYWSFSCLKTVFCDFCGQRYLQSSLGRAAPKRWRWAPLISSWSWDQHLATSSWALHWDFPWISHGFSPKKHGDVVVYPLVN